MNPKKKDGIVSTRKPEKKNALEEKENEGFVKVFLRPGITRMGLSRKAIDTIIKNEMRQDPFSGNVFLFCNQDRTIVKSVFGLGETKIYLPSGRKYFWPDNEEPYRELSFAEYRALLEGKDFQLQK
jgi:hypothetical protein